MSKKIFGFILSFIMLCSISMNAFAAEPITGSPDGEEIILEQTADGNYEGTIYFYSSDKDRSGFVATMDVNLHRFTGDMFEVSYKMTSNSPVYYIHADAVFCISTSIVSQKIYFDSPINQRITAGTNHSDVLGKAYIPSTEKSVKLGFKGTYLDTLSYDRVYGLSGSKVVNPGILNLEEQEGILYAG